MAGRDGAFLAERVDPVSEAEGEEDFKQPFLVAVGVAGAAGYGLAFCGHGSGVGLVGEFLSELHGASGQFFQSFENRNAYSLACHDIVNMSFGAADGSSCRSHSITLVY